VSEWIDLHTHLLPGFDDGAKDAAEALEILFQAQQAGFAGVVATPHFMAGVYEHDRPAVQQAIAALAADMAKQTPGVTLYPGSEYYLDDQFYRLLEDAALMPLAGGTHVLVELPLLRLPPMTKEFAFRMRIKGLTPVLAHPERYGDVTRDPKLAEQLATAGYRLQINLGSLAGMYGRKVRKAAEWMLKHDLVDFVGSDAHTPQQATEAFGEGLAVLLELVDEARQRRMLVDNPRQALTGETP
jgi:protein-tyrosine phosphatase